MARRIDLQRAALRGPTVSDPAHYRTRVRWLAIVHVTLFVASLAGIVLLVWGGELLVTLAQRSNVETMTIAFLLLFFGYFAVITAHGAIGGVRIGMFHLRALTMRDDARLEAAKIAVLGAPGPGPAAAFDRAIEVEGHPGEAWEIALRDDHGFVVRDAGGRPARARAHLLLHREAAVGSRGLAISAIAAVAAIGCAGPDPRIERAEIVPPQRPGTVRVDLVIVNRSGGHGQAQIEIRLRSIVPPRTLAAERELELEAHERFELTVDIAAPEGRYVVEAHARYPH